MAKEVMQTYTFRARPSKYLKVIKKAKKEKCSEAHIIRTLIEKYL